MKKDFAERQGRGGWKGFQRSNLTKNEGGRSQALRTNALKRGEEISVRPGERKGFFWVDAELITNWKGRKIASPPRDRKITGGKRQTGTDT